MKIFLVFFILLNTITFAKDCYKDKASRKVICFYKYFDRKNIYKPKANETYYITRNRSIYAIGDLIEVKFKSVGAILTILDDYEIDFVDKKKNETYIFKARNPHEVFTIIGKLNDLTAIRRAQPIKKRKYTKAEVQRRVAAKKERLEKALEKSKAAAAAKAAAKGKMGGGANFKGGNFLKGEH